MAVYNMSKIKEWYEDFNSCKSNYLNNYYQSYKSSYIVTNNDSSVSRMQKKLDGYYSRLKNAYSKVGNTWKNLYNDLMNADAALAGQKSSGSVNASGASAKISSMPKLVEYKNDLGLTGAAGVSAIAAGAVTGITYGAQQVQNQAMQTAASNVQEGAIQVSQSVSETTESSKGGLKNTLIGAASGAAIGAAVASVVPGVGTLIGAGVGALVGALIGSGVVSKIVEAISKGVTEIKGKVNEVVSEVKSADTVSEKLKVMGKGAVEVLKKTGATVATVGVSAVEGLAKLVEDVVDLGALVGTAVVSIGTGVMDLGNLIGAKITGDDSYKSDYTKRMWEGTRSFVSKDHVGNLFDKFYDNTSAGQWIKENAFAFDTTRAITKEVAEVVGVVALSTVTGGGAAVMYGAAKVAEHTETNWQDENTSTGKGLLKGVLQGVADGAFFAVGLKGDKALKASAEAASKTALKKAGIEVTQNASKKVLQESLKGLSKESAKALSKDLTKMLAKKTAFECSTAVAQDLGTIGIDTILSNNTVTDENGNVIKLNSLSDKWNYYYNKAGGTQGLAQSMITAGVLSGLSDIGDTRGLLKGAKQVQRQANKTAVKSAASAVTGKVIDSASMIKNKIDSSTIKQKVTNSALNTKSKLHSANLKTSYRLDQLKASANIKLVNGGLIVAEKAIGLKNAIKSFSGDAISRVKNKIDSSTIKQKVTDSALNTKSKLHSANLKTSYRLDQLKASANLKLTKTKITSASKALNLGLIIKNFSGDTISKVKNKLDSTAIKQKVTDSVANTKSKISTAKKVVSGIGSNIAEYSKTNLKNVNLKLKKGLSNTKFKLTNGVATLSGTAISLKNKLKASVDDTANKIGKNKQLKNEPVNITTSKKQYAEPTFKTIQDFSNIMKSDGKSDAKIIDLLHNTLMNSAFGGKKEALDIIDAIARIKSQNPNFKIVSVNSSSCYWQASTSTLVLGKLNANWGDSGTLCHELGHCLFYNVLGEKIPDSWSDVVKNSIKKTGSSNRFKSMQRELNEISEKALKEAKSSFENTYGMSTKQYRDKIALQYKDNYQSKIDELLIHLKKNTNTNEKTIKNIEDGIKKGLYTPEKLANIEVNSIVTTEKERIMRTKYGDYTALSDMIDALYKGEKIDVNGNNINVTYQHGKKYYEGFTKSNGEFVKFSDLKSDTMQFHELIAQFTKIKLTGNESSLNSIREMFGDEFYNILEQTYNSFKLS